MAMPERLAGIKTKDSLEVAGAPKPLETPVVRGFTPRKKPAGDKPLRHRVAFRAKE